MNTIEHTVDFHAHILPGADHGAKSTEVSKKQLKLAEAAGVEYVIATPHFYPHKDSVDDFLARRDASYQHLLKACGGRLRPRILLGAEILMCRDIDRLPEIEKLTVAGTNILLIELPKTDEYDFLVDIARELMEGGYELLLAHAERYPYNIVVKMAEIGVKLQLNASVFDRFLINRHIRKYLNNGWVYAIGSDIHGDDKKAYRSFIKATKRIYPASQDLNKLISEVDYE